MPIPIPMRTCDLQPATCDLRPATCDVRLATCDVRLATCDQEKKSQKNLRPSGF
jgi:hypothetical protein